MNADKFCDAVRGSKSHCILIAPLDFKADGIINVKADDVVDDDGMVVVPRKEPIALPALAVASLVPLVGLGCPTIADDINRADLSIADPVAPQSAIVDFIDLVLCFVLCLSFVLSFDLSKQRKTEKTAKYNVQCVNV